MVALPVAHSNLNTHAQQQRTLKASAQEYVAMASE